MSYMNRLQLAFLFCLGFAVAPAFISTGFAQQDIGSEPEIQIDPEVILGEADEEDEALSRLVDKSTIANLEFLNSGESPTSIEQLKAMQQHVASLYQRVEPAVVNIRSGMGQGSGVVVTSDGYILTAAHVIAVPNRSAVITFPDGSQARAQTLGMFRSLDAGLLKIYSMVPSDDEEDEGEEGEDEDNNADEGESNDDEGDDEEGGVDEDDDSSDEQLESPETDESDEGEEKEQTDRFAVEDDLPSFNYLEIGESDGLKLGQWVIAVGHPGGLDEDRGIVLRVGRINEIEADTDDAYLRTDCTLVGGDSGGPLIGMDGSVIGIHSRIGMKLRQNFHVPSGEFMNNWTALLEPVVHDRDPQLSIRFRGRTNVIEKVSARSLAARSGLMNSDRIIRIGDKDIYDKLQFDDAISKLKPFQEVEFEVQRKGKKKVIKVMIGEKSEMRGLR